MHDLKSETASAGELALSEPVASEPGTAARTALVEPPSAARVTSARPRRASHRTPFAWTAVRLFASILWEGLANTVNLVRYVVVRRSVQQACERTVRGDGRDERWRLAPSAVQVAGRRDKRPRHARRHARKRLPGGTSAVLLAAALMTAIFGNGCSTVGSAFVEGVTKDAEETAWTVMSLTDFSGDFASLAEDVGKLTEVESFDEFVFSFNAMTGVHEVGSDAEEFGWTLGHLSDVRSDLGALEETLVLFLR